MARSRSRPRARAGSGDAPGFAEVEAAGRPRRPSPSPGAATLAERGGDRHRGPDRDEAGRHGREGRRPRPGGHRRERRADPRRHAAAGAGVQPVPAVGQPGRQPHLPGRVPSRRGAERGQPHARPPRRRALERRLRGLGLLEPRPRAAIERVEVLEGGASDLYGSAALGGVVQALGRSDDTAVALDASLGNEDTAVGSVFVAGRSGPWSARAAGEAFTTAGYVQVADDERGPVDVAAGTAHLSGSLEVEPAPVALGHGLRAGLAPRREPGERHAPAGERHGLPAGERRSRLERENGRRLAAGVVRHPDLSPDVQRPVRRSCERDVDAAAAGARRRPEASRSSGRARPGTRHALVAGVEGRFVRGRSDDTVFASGTASALVSAGGRQRTWALFAADRVSLGSRVRLTLGARVDRWWEEDGSESTTPFATNVTSTTPLPRSGRDGGEPAPVGARPRHAARCPSARPATAPSAPPP